MEKALFGLSLFILTFLNAEGQWYAKQYNVQDINQLTKPQLEISLAQTKEYLLTASLVSGMGVIGWAILGYSHIAIIGSYICAGIFAGGAIVSIGYMQRIGAIKSALRRNYPSLHGSISISPALIKNNSTRNICSGISLTYNF
jgi:hypothetical protein